MVAEPIKCWRCGRAGTTGFLPEGARHRCADLKQCRHAARKRRLGQAKRKGRAAVERLPGSALKHNQLVQDPAGRGPWRVRHHETYCGLACVIVAHVDEPARVQRFAATVLFTPLPPRQAAGVAPPGARPDLGLAGC